MVLRMTGFPLRPVSFTVYTKVGGMEASVFHRRKQKLVFSQPAGSFQCLYIWVSNLRKVEVTWFRESRFSALLVKLNAKKSLLVTQKVSQSFLLANLQFNSGSGKQALEVVPVWQWHRWHLENELLSFSLISSEYITKNPFSAYILVPTNCNCLWIIRDAFVQMMLPQKQMVVIASFYPQHRNQTLNHKTHCSLRPRAQKERKKAQILESRAR